MGRKTSLVASYYRDAICEESLFEFFKNEKLRFYLHDILGPKVKISDGKHRYNPAMVHLMFKVHIFFISILDQTLQYI